MDNEQVDQPDAEGALRLLRERFLRGDDRWPHLHHGQLSGPQGIPPLSYFNRCLPPIVIKEIAPDHEVVSIGSNFFAMSIYWDLPPINKGSVVLLHELMTCACRCIYGSAYVDEFQNRDMHTFWWPSVFMEWIYKDLRKYSDPLHFIRKHQLLANDSGKFSIGEMYDFEAPKGYATGFQGRRRRWPNLLRDYVKMGTVLRTFEQGIFRVAARAIDLILAGAEHTMPPFTREEIAVLTVLKEADSYLTQTEIGKRTLHTSFGATISRATLSRLIQGFESRRLIDRKIGKGVAFSKEGWKLAGQFKPEP